MNTETSNFVKGMEKAGRIAALALQNTAKAVRAGISTLEIDQIAHDFMLSLGATPATLGYLGYPKSCCTSVNDVICHGVPDSTILKNGDIINIDVTAIVGGYFGDTSATFFVGEVSDKAKKITEVARLGMMKGIEAITPNGKTGDIGFATEKVVSRSGFHVVREIGGHGIGKIFHDDPFVPAFGKKGRGETLRPWTCITVEPMINETNVPIRELPIQGSEHKIYLTGDHTLSAQFEHTILITDRGYEVITSLD